MVVSISFSLTFLPTAAVCSLGDDYVHNELASEDAQHSSGRNVIEEEIAHQYELRP